MMNQQPGDLPRGNDYDLREKGDGTHEP